MSRPRPSAARGPRTGLTLLELLLVMGLLGLVLGTGLGVFATRDTVEPLAPSVARSALRSAAGAARLDRAPVSVVWDAAGSTLAIHAPRTVGTWHFEPESTRRRLAALDSRPRSMLRGGDGLVGTLRGGEWVEPAWIGTGIDLAVGAGDATFGLPLHLVEGHDFEHGFALQLALRPTDAREGIVWSLGEIAGLEFRAGGGLEAWIVLRADDDPTGQRLGGRVETVLPPGTAPADEWTLVEVLYDRIELRVTVDGFPAALVPVPSGAGLPRLDGPLVLGDRRRAFRGQVDALVVRAYEFGEPLVLPEGELWPADAPARVRFDADGTLDPALHPEPLRLRFETAPGQEEFVWVSRYGTVE